MPLACEEDLFVEGVLFLEDLRLTTRTGCRIYATGTVFGQGAIEYLHDQSDTNLQISSSRAISLGLGHGPVYFPSYGTTVNNSLYYRLRDLWCAPGMFTRENVNPAATSNAIIADSELIPELLDAAIQRGGRNVGFERLLLVCY